MAKHKFYSPCKVCSGAGVDDRSERVVRQMVHNTLVCVMDHVKRTSEETSQQTFSLFSSKPSTPSVSSSGSYGESIYFFVFLWDRLLYVVYI